MRIVSNAEEEKKKKFRRSLVVQESLKEGHIITENDLTAKRPGTKIAPDEMEFVVGRALKQDVSKDQLLEWHMFN